MKTRIFVLLVIFIGATSAGAVQFGPNSANITNPYVPLVIGDWGYNQGVGTEWKTRIFHTHVIGTDTVSGARIGGKVFNNVKCLNVNIILSDDGGLGVHEFLTLSFAQDTNGNLWILKVYSHVYDITALLGGEFFKSMFMPASPAVGLSAGLKLPEDEQNYCRIEEVGITTLKTSFNTFKDCIKVHCYDEDPIDIEIEYYCRGVGGVSQSNNDSPGNVLDLKVFGRAVDKRISVIPF